MFLSILYTIIAMIMQFGPLSSKIMTTTATTRIMINMTNDMETNTMNTILQKDTNIGFFTQNFLSFGPFVAGWQVVRRTPTSPAPSTPRTFSNRLIQRVLARL